MKVLSRWRKEQGILGEPPQPYLLEVKLPLTKWWKCFLPPVACVAVVSVSLFHIFSAWQQKQIVFVLFFSPFVLSIYRFLLPCILTEWLYKKNSSLNSLFNSLFSSHCSNNYKSCRFFLSPNQTASLKVPTLFSPCFPVSHSSVFLAEQFESLQSHLDAMMPAAKKPFLQQFYSQVALPVHYS